MNAFFYVDESGRVVVRARAEGDGVIGDMIEDIHRGEAFFGVTYDEMKKRGSGKLTVKDGRGRISD